MPPRLFPPPETDDEAQQRCPQANLHRELTTVDQPRKDVETDWAQQLGPRKFAQLRALLTELGAIVTPTDNRR